MPTARGRASLPIRILSVFLLLCVPAHAIEPCPGKIMSREERKVYIENQLKENLAIADALIQSKFSETTQKIMSEKIAATCDAQGFCTPEQVAIVVTKTWEEVLAKATADEPTKFEKLKNYTKGTLFVVSSVIAGSYGIAFSKDVLASIYAESALWKETVNVSMNIFSMAIVLAFAAPISKTTAAFFERIGFGIFQGKSPFKKKSKVSDYLNIVFNRSKSKLTDTQGQARSIVNNFSGNLYQRALDASSVLLYSDSEISRNRAATLLADLVKNKRKYHPEIHYDDPDILSEMHLIFVESIAQAEVREDIAKRAYALLKKYDPETQSDGSILKYYQDVLRAWLKVDKTL